MPFDGEADARGTTSGRVERNRHLSEKRHVSDSTWQTHGMDPRIARTRQSLQQALLALAREESLDAISVADIAARAGVHRSSFYQHYADKETLLADAIDATVDEAAERSLATGLASGAVAPDEQQILRTLEVFLEHASANASLFRRVLGPHGSALATARMRDRIDGIVREGIEHARESGAVPANDVPVDLEVAAVSGAAIAAVGQWLHMRPRPAPTQAAAWIWTLLSTSLIPVHP
ncbi:DNA-binding transcriptional regulator, AcrR family [Agrococcus jejuensis]|uniref:DNA-binding transcriptional regulator, AcrR family n=2 Tax=Agrococcus jejuensis TaxID=399736 RepID=A0A1G8D9I1_9MICO|nr:DNA-binding transcriptional regulator, AcrR family [Agrococcus jejuensis]